MDIGSFVKKNLMKIIILTAIVILVVFFAGFLSTPTGKTVFSQLMGQFPFSKFVYDTVKKIYGFSESLPNITVNAVSLDLVKLFISSGIRCFIFYFCAKIFLTIHIPVNQIIRGFSKDYELLEKAENSFLYKLKKFIISIIAAVISVMAGNFIIDKTTSLAERFLGERIRTVVYIILLIIFYLLYSKFFAWISGMKFRLALLKTTVFNILPSLISTFGTTLFCLGVYMCAVLSGFSWKTVLSVICLLIWQIIADWLDKKLGTTFAECYLTEKKLGLRSNVRLAAFFALAAVYTSLIAMYYLSYNDIDYIGNYDTTLFQLFLNFPNIPFFDFFEMRLPASALFTSHFDLLLLSIPKVLIFSATVTILQKIMRPTNIIVWLLYVGIVTAGTVVLYSLFTYLFDNFDTFWVIGAIVLLLIVLVLTKQGTALNLLFEILLMSVFVLIIAVAFAFIPNTTIANTIILPTSSTLFTVVAIIAELSFTGIWLVMDIFGDD